MNSKDVESPHSSSSLLLLGLDGATWKIMDPLLKDGSMPHVQALIEHGTHGILETLDCLISPVIWTSIATGKMPAKHGIHSFSAQKIGRKVINLEWRWKRILTRPLYPLYEFVKRVGLVKSIPPSARMRTAKAIWEILEARNRPSGLVGWWGTWPAQPLSGGVVSDRAYHSLERSTYPDSLVADVAPFRREHEGITLSEARQFVGIDPDREGEFYSKSVKEDRWFGYAYLNDEFFGRAAQHLVATNPSCSYFFYLRGIDLLQHALWNYVEPEPFLNQPEAADMRRYGNTIAQYYSYIDEFVGQVVGSLRGDHLVMIASDHGMKAAPSSDNPGDHDDEAVFIASGPNVAHISERIEGHVLDIVPTALYLMGLPVGEDMDGRVMTEAIEEEFLKANPIRYIQSYEDEDRQAQYLESEADEEIIERLRGLGYID